MNYIWVTSRMMFQILKIEIALEDARNRLYLRAYEQNSRMPRQKRVALISLLLAEQDEECMEIMAKVFQEQPAYAEDHLYWDLHLTEPELGPADQERKVDRENDASCTVM